MEDFIRISPSDNVAVAVHDVQGGVTCNMDGKVVAVKEPIPAGHKVALSDLKAEDNVIKYGFPIGHLLEDVSEGCRIDHNNLKTNLEGLAEYVYQPENIPVCRAEAPAFFKG